MEELSYLKRNDKKETVINKKKLIKINKERTSKKEML